MKEYKSIAIDISKIFSISEYMQVRDNELNKQAQYGWRVVAVEGEFAILQTPSIASQYRKVIFLLERDTYSTTKVKVEG